MEVNNATDKQYRLFMSFFDAIIIRNICCKKRAEERKI